MHSWITISQSALYHNIRTITSLVHPLELGCVVKNNAYGHGCDIITDALMAHDASRYMFTASAQEAVAIAQRHPHARICVMSCIDTSYAACVKHDIACGVYDTRDIAALDQEAAAHGRPMRIHLKVDTGMARLGVNVDDAAWYIEYIRSCRHLYLEGIYTHLADLATEDARISRSQIRAFRSLYTMYHDQIPYWHAGSSGSITWEHACNLTRVGSALYGVVKSDHQARELAHTGAMLKPVLSWHARIITTKWVSSGVPVGYDGTCVTSRETCLAYIPIGYGDGFPRSASHHAWVYVRGMYAPIVGLIAMNMITIDITDIPNISVGDVVTMIGDQPQIHPMYLARNAGRITLEVLSNINPNIPRISAS